MIFVTVGTQLPFDRLVSAVDAWAAAHPQEEVFVQAGATAAPPRHCRHVTFTTSGEWEEWFGRCRVVVSHAGMGTILKCLDHGKPIVAMPRRARFGEHRSDHQLATAARFAGLAGVRIAHDAEQLWTEIGAALQSSAARLVPGENLARLHDTIRQFIGA